MLRTQRVDLCRHRAGPHLTSEQFKIGPRQENNSFAAGRPAFAGIGNSLISQSMGQQVALALRSRANNSAVLS
jgi:hypothetical protein